MILKKLAFLQLYLTGITYCTDCKNGLRWGKKLVVLLLFKTFICIDNRFIHIYICIYLAVDGCLDTYIYFKIRIKETLQ